MDIERIKVEPVNMLCRLCTTESNTMFQIFSPEAERLDISEKISRCLPVIIHPTDGMPVNICESCMKKLNMSYDLIMTALNAEAYFKAKCLHQGSIEQTVKERDDNCNYNDCDYLDSDDSLCENMVQPSGHVIREVMLGDDGYIELKGEKQQQKDGMQLERISQKKHVIADKSQMDRASLQKILENDIDSTSPKEEFDISVQNINGPAVCDVCGRVFTDMDEFDEHVAAQHLLKLKYQCNLCDESFEESVGLVNHKKKEHSGSVVSCVKCSTNPQLMEGLIVHVKKEFGSVDFEDGDSQEFIQQLHSREGLARKPKIHLRCSICKDIFVDEELFINHMKLGKQSFKCDICFKRFCEREKLLQHVKIHDPAFWDRFKCQVCSRPFRDGQGLSNHLLLHTGFKPHMCDICGRTYNRYANMIKHRKKHKPASQWEHKCHHCEACFEKFNDMMAHIESSHPLQNIPESTKDNRSNYGKHFKWVCRFCGKRISTKLSLQDHERIHTGLKPFICEWCGRDFRSRPNLLQHHLTHTGDRKHACDVCGKRFARKSFIAQHMRVHTGEKPYECNICGHRFTQAGDMRRHRRRHLEAKAERPSVVVRVLEDDDIIKIE